MQRHLLGLGSHQVVYNVAERQDNAKGAIYGTAGDLQEINVLYAERIYTLRPPICILCRLKLS